MSWHRRTSQAQAPRANYSRRSTKSPALRGQSFSQRPPPPGAAARRRLPIVGRAAQRPHALRPLPPARSRHGPPIIVPPGLPSPTSRARSGQRCRCEPVHHTRPRAHIAPSHRHACRHPAPRVHRRRRLRRRPTRRRPVLLCQPRLRENEDAALRRQRLVFILLPSRRGLLSLRASPRLRRSQARIRPREAPSSALRARRNGRGIALPGHRKQHALAE